MCSDCQEEECLRERRREICRRRRRRRRLNDGHQMKGGDAFSNFPPLCSDVTAREWTHSTAAAAAAAAGGFLTMRATAGTELGAAAAEEHLDVTSRHDDFSREKLSLLKTRRRQI